MTTPLPRPRLLLGPGPSDVPSSVLDAMRHPVVGHLDPGYLALMDRVQAKLRLAFGTSNEWTWAVPGTGTSGMEACLASLLAPGDRAVVGVAGYFGARMVEIAARVGAEVRVVEAAWGEIVPVERLVAEIRATKPRVVALVQAETSTGIEQPLADAIAAAHEVGALVVVDAVTSFCGLSLRVDALEIDAAYSCTQKCVGAPPGLAPITLSRRAREAILARVASSRGPSTFYLDLALLAKYWSGERVYHHTAPASLFYALETALDLVLEEGLEARWARHRLHHRALVAAFAVLGLSLASAAEHQLPTLHAVRVPDGIDEAKVRIALRETHDIEVGAGLGPWRGQVWRVGLMGGSSEPAKIARFVRAFAEVLRDAGHRGQNVGGPDDAVRAAQQVLFAASS